MGKVEAAAKLQVAMQTITKDHEYVAKFLQAMNWNPDDKRDDLRISTIMDNTGTPLFALKSGTSLLVLLVLPALLVLPEAPVLPALLALLPVYWCYLYHLHYLYYMYYFYYFYYFYYLYYL